jgi:hypothetical protein
MRVNAIQGFLGKSAGTSEDPDIASRATLAESSFVSSMDAA